MKYKTPAALEMAVRNAARESPMDTNRAIVGFYFHRFLCRVFSEDDCRVVLKGGQSVLARTLDARVTRDIDLVAQEESLEEAVADLVRAASIDLEDFVSFVFDRAEQIKEEDEYRCGAKVWFTPFMGTKKLQPISIDLVIDEVRGLEPEVLAPIDRLNIEGLPVCDYRVCRVESALADKLLAMIEMHEGCASSRIKDIVDILGQFTRNYTQTVKRAADNKRRYAPGEGSIPPVLLSGVSKGVPPLAHDFACKV